MSRQFIQAGNKAWPCYRSTPVLAPVKTPKPHLQCIHETLLKALRVPETASQFEAQGADPVGNGSKEFSAFLRREYDKCASAVRTSGLKID